jgi:hypothetical protein
LSSWRPSEAGAALPHGEHDGNKLLFSSEWNGGKTVEGPLGGGNLVVH